MKEVIDFFRRLHDNNDRAWFDAHRAEWAHVKGRFAAFTEQLIAGISEFDPTVRGLRVQDCTYRIARDTRFSPDKSPYKTYIGAYIAPKGKKSGFAGYYFHIGPCCDSLVWSNGADFDVPMLAHAFSQVQMEMPWKFFNSRCFRTYKNLPGAKNVGVPFAGTKHNALADAYHQAQTLQAIHAALFNTKTTKVKA